MNWLEKQASEFEKEGRKLQWQIVKRKGGEPMSIEETTEEAQARMVRKCGRCPKEVHYMELTREGLCPECAEKERKEANNDKAGA